MKRDIKNSSYILYGISLVLTSTYTFPKSGLWRREEKLVIQVWKCSLEYYIVSLYMAVYQFLTINLFSSFVFILKLELGKCPKGKCESLNSIAPSEVYLSVQFKELKSNEPSFAVLLVFAWSPFMQLINNINFPGYFPS